MRRSPARFLLLLLTPLASLPAAQKGSAGPSESKPNIVYILADDLGYGDVQCLNPKRGRIPTPHFDRFATQGMTFTDAHSGSSVCTPTRYGVLTGRYAWRTRLQSGVLLGGNEDPLISADRLTAPALLRQQGYATACIGKWHLGFQSDSETRTNDNPKLAGGSGLPAGARIIGGPTTRGFDYYWGCSNARTLASLIENERVVKLLPAIEMLPRLTQRAVEYVGERAAAAKSGRPFFLYVPLTSPHTPILPGAEWAGRSGLGRYGDFVMQTDDSVGRILAALDEQGLTETTLVIVTSDNGCAVQAGVKALEAQGHFASAQYRGYKTDIWEGGHRMPFFVRWPGRVKAGSISDATICLGDFMATAAEILDVRLPESAAPDSVSFLALLQGVPSAAGRVDIVHHSQMGQFAIRQGRWKLAFGGGSGGLGRPTDDEARKQNLPDAQLYDLDADPGETTNLIATHRAITARLTALLETQIANGRSTPGPKLTNDVEVMLPTLRPEILHSEESR